MLSKHKKNESHRAVVFTNIKFSTAYQSKTLNIKSILHNTPYVVVKLSRISFNRHWSCFLSTSYWCYALCVFDLTLVVTALYTFSLDQLFITWQFCLLIVAQQISRSTELLYVLKLCIIWRHASCTLNCRFLFN